LVLNVLDATGLVANGKVLGVFPVSSCGGGKGTNCSTAVRTIGRPVVALLATFVAAVAA
jgi:hypothetical protein